MNALWSPLRRSWFFAFLSLSSCASSPAAQTTLIRLRPEPVGAHCGNGGSVIEAGADANSNRTLEDGEITDTQYVCNGAPGATGVSGPAVLVALVAEPSGVQCASGGTKVLAGTDTDANGILGPAEVVTTSYVCDGSPGATGTVVLVEMSAEPAGTNCPSGGTKLLTGLDRDGNSILGGAEVTATSYVCDGARGPGITWVSVTTAAQQAVSNTGYLANNASGRAVITLPSNPAPGDIVQVTGVGAGGWFIAQNAGQRIDGRNLGLAPGTTWKSLLNAPGVPTTPQWYGVASSADGMKLVGAGDVRDEQVHTSTDMGQTWLVHGTDAGLPQRLGDTRLASSAAGDKLTLTDGKNDGSGRIWLSTNGGATWTAPGAPSGLPATTPYWRCVASSADGSKLVVGESSGPLWTSNNGGANWTSRGVASGLPAAASWNGIASSSDGTRLAAAGNSGIYLSVDSGATWSIAGAFPGLSAWRSITSSADGTRLVAAEAPGRLWTSDNGGVTWDAREQVRYWVSVTSSADGSHLLAAANTEHLYTSTDFGVTWTPRGPRRFWQGVVGSSDGTRLLAMLDDELFVSSLDTTPGTAGGVSGTQGDTVSLQHVGGGAFVVLSASGAGLGLQ